MKSILRGFVENGGTDTSTVDYLIKSNLVEKEVVVRGKHGLYTAKRLVNPDKERGASGESRREKEVIPNKRKEVPATPVRRTESNKHLVPLKDLKELPEHLKGKIPPDYREVLVSKDPEADMLAVGKDNQNRLVYVYSERFIREKQQEKFDRISKVNMKQVEQTIQDLKEMDSDSAECLTLIMKMGIRPGSTRDTKSKQQAYGATTLKGKHVVIDGEKVYLDFVGKKGVHQIHEVTDEELKTILKSRKSGDEEDLFKTSDGKLREIMSVIGIKPKDLRTLLATNIAGGLLEERSKPISLKEFKKAMLEVGEFVSKKLGNTRKIALESYINEKKFQEWSPRYYEEWKSQGGNFTNGKSKKPKEN